MTIKIENQSTMRKIYYSHQIVAMRMETRRTVNMHCKILQLEWWRTIRRCRQWLPVRPVMLLVKQMRSLGPSLVFITGHRGVVLWSERLCVCGLLCNVCGKRCWDKVWPKFEPGSNFLKNIKQIWFTQSKEISFHITGFRYLNITEVISCRYFF